MIHIDDDGAGLVQVWFETVAGWALLARGADELAVLVDAEKLLRDELDDVQARLHAIRQTDARRRADTY